MRKATVTYSFRDNQSVPMIRLRGKWLSQVGFEEGRRVHVEVADGRLTLILADGSDSEGQDELSR